MIDQSGGVLEGRTEARERLSSLLGQARQRRGGALVLCGEAGTGKTTLLNLAASSASADLLVLRCTGVEGEAGLPYAGLHRLLHRLLDRTDTLPGPQAAALAGAFGLGEANADRFLVALAALTLLTEAAEHRTILVLADDVQWLDAASRDALIFIARRLEADSVAILFGHRDGSGSEFPAPDLPMLRVGPLDATESRRLLARCGVPLAAETANRLLAEAAGNPLALVELPRSLNAEQLRGQQPLPARLPLGQRLRQAFQARLRTLPPRTRTLLLLAAAYGASDLGTLLAAGALLGATPEHLAAAERVELIWLDDRDLRFRHPLIRSAVYQSASYLERQSAHRALAQVLTDEPERRTWHLAEACPTTDDALAADLARAAERARRTGAVATAVIGLERAAALTANRADQLRYLADAAHSAWQAGQRNHAIALLDRVQEQPGDAVLTARAASLRGFIVHASSSPSQARHIFVAGARALCGLEPELAGEMLVLAARSAWVADEAAALGEIGRLIGLLQLPERGPVKRLGQRFTALARRDLRLPEPLAQHTREATLAWLRPPEPQPWIWPPTLLPYLLGESEEVAHALQDAVALLRTRGAAGTLPMSLPPLVALEASGGNWVSAVANGNEALALADETGQQGAACHLRVLLAWIAAMKGDGAACRELAERALGVAVPHGIASAVAIAHWALGLLALGEGRADDAVEILEQVVTPGTSASHFMVSLAVLPDLVEAAVRAGQTRRARWALEQLESWTLGEDDTTLHAMLERCQALVHSCGHRGEHFRRAGDGTVLSPFESARTQLLHGEWLRRERRLKEARQQLHAALGRFRSLGAEPWAERTRAELRAAGEAVQDEAAETGPMAELTARETQIVRFAARGMSNREIAAQLFLSPRTVGYHLYKIFPKLGVSSRHQLRDLGIAAEDDAQA
ncbi:AAA family ATPase [Kitasatospora sp. NPDC052896]|uniref:helix-turn-helix transcriptional regulator n=1 Tax=Kitasatospora sp. NPDC052896 TaxID=3364061 RepID=UPI0037C8B52E